jgi:hypothetical protein
MLADVAGVLNHNGISIATVYQQDLEDDPAAGGTGAGSVYWLWAGPQVFIAKMNDDLSGLAEAPAPGQCASIASRMKASRTGFTWCRLAIGPLGFHQSRARPAKKSASSGRIVTFETFAFPIMRP